MSEPSRWRHDGPAELRELLRHAPRTRVMTPGERARTRRRLVHAAGVTAALGSIVWIQGAALGAGLGVLVVGAAHFVPQWIAPARTTAPEVTAAPVVPRPQVAPPVETTEPAASAAPAEPLKSATRAPDAPPPPHVEEASAPAGKVDSLAEEAAMLEPARAALAADPAGALALTEAYAARFPAGKLGMEREILAIDALVRLGRTAEARARGDALLARAQGGLYAARVKRILDGNR